MSKRLLINEIDIPSRVFYCLMRHRIKDLNELSEYTLDEIKSIPNVGDKTFKDIIRACQKYNVSIKNLPFEPILYLYECIFTLYKNNDLNDTLTLTQHVVAYNEDEVKMHIKKAWNNKVFDTMKIKYVDVYNGMIL